jgi:hypothetical protein
MRWANFRGASIRSQVLLVVLFCIPIGHAQESPSIPKGLDSLTQMDRLPLLRHDVWFHSVSSQDVTGGNSDGFNAEFSNQYVENGRYVFLDTRGPACVQLFWASRLNVFTNQMGFDGDLTIETRRGGKPKTDVVPFGDLYSGKRAPFLAPLVQEERGGHGSSWSFVPICSEDGIKISTDKGGPLLFHEIYYHSFSRGTEVEAFTPELDVGPAIDRWKAVGQPLDRRPSKPATREVEVPARTIVPIWTSSEPGTVTAIHLKLGNISHEALRHVRIKAYWDGEVEPSVNSPLGPFFGTGYWPAPDPPGATSRYGFTPTTLKTGAVELGRIETRSLPVGATKDGLYNFFPMPFFKSARIDLVNESDAPLSDVGVTVNTVAGAPPPSSAHFHAQWREENPTRPYHDYTVLETRGHGHYVGAVLIMSSIDYDPTKRGEGQRWYLEGDARFYIDDKRTFVNGSTGTEDYVMGGWYDLGTMDKVFSLPANGYPVHDIDSQDHTVMYRFQLSDLVPYYRSFRFALEHGPEGNIPTDYSGTAFYYQVDTPSLELTDQLTMSDSQSEQSHAYFPGKIVWKGCRDLPFEGDCQIVFTNAYKADLKNGTQESLRETVHACGQRSTGAIEFTASVLSDNKGLELRRMLDYASPDILDQEMDKRPKPLIAPGEAAQVFVDGKSIGEWYEPARHARLAWLEDEFEIPAQFTAGKSQVRIRLEVAPESSWSAYQYRVYSYR